MKYQHVPIQVDAIQYDGSFSGAQAVSALLTANAILGGVTISYDNGAVKALTIPGDKSDADPRTIQPGNWIFVTKDKDVLVLPDTDFNETYRVAN